MTQAALAPPLKPRRTARERLVRRARIMERLREGRSYEEIAQAEGLSRERIRQIVVQALSQREVEAQRDHAQLQMLRLAPALRLAAQGVAEGDRAAITALIRVLDRLDKYQAAGGAAELTYDEGARERLLTKLNTMSERMIAARRRQGGETPAGAGDGAPGSGPGQGTEGPEGAAGSQQSDFTPPWGLTP